MGKTFIGLLFIMTGLLYGSLAVDSIYNHTLGWLVENKWIVPPVPDKKSLTTVLGRKPTILLYATGFIIIGIFILWTRGN